MLEQDTACHIVKTASLAGLLSGHPSASYQVTKHAVVALSEHLYHSLAEQQAKIGVSVLCPGYVRTRIMESGRNRPAARPSAAPAEPPTAESAARRRAHGALQNVLQPGESHSRTRPAPARLSRPGTAG